MPFFLLRRHDRCQPLQSAWSVLYLHVRPVDVKHISRLYYLFKILSVRFLPPFDGKQVLYLDLAKYLSSRRLSVLVTRLVILLPSHGLIFSKLRLRCPSIAWLPSEWSECSNTVNSSR